MSQSTISKILITLAVLLGLWLGTQYLLPIAIPFLLAALLAVAAEPLVRVFHKRLKLPRAAASGIGVLIALVVAALAVLVLCALLVRELGQLAGILPDLEGTAMQGIDSLEGFLLRMAEKTPDAVSPILVHGVEGFFSDGTALLDQLSTKVLQLASGVVTRIPDSAFGFGTWILASFMISARLPQLRHWLKSRLPESWQQTYLPAVKRLKSNVSGWLKAQVKLIGVTFLVLTIGFLTLQIRYAPFWAAIISLVDALPVLGTGMILVPWSLVCLLQGDTIRAIGLLGTYAAASILRSVLEPKFIGKQLGLDPLVTLLAIYAGYRIWGILGMVFAPLLAITITQLVTAAKEK